ncbi:hypothetical protein [Methylocaldum gracile]|jgi:hypothetical protein|uniref:hypothetical protein n=1 Tax=Methylocaldum sp. 0917 TaxID=2485163 RepID=UPI001B5D5D1C
MDYNTRPIMKKAAPGNSNAAPHQVPAIIARMLTATRMVPIACNFPLKLRIGAALKARPQCGQALA